MCMVWCRRHCGITIPYSEPSKASERMRPMQKKKIYAECRIKVGMRPDAVRQLKTWTHFYVAAEDLVVADVD